MTSEEKEKRAQQGSADSGAPDNGSRMQPEEEADINVDENIRGTAHLNDEIQEESMLDKLENELQEMKNKYLRLVADFDNYRKRMARDRVELAQTASKEVILSLLDILDDWDRAEKQMEKTTDVEVIKEGITLIFNKLQNTLQAKGLQEMESLHTPFDPDLHDAITEVPAPSEALKGKVIDNVQKGYYLNDKLIRHAKVVVGK